jgi:hypothetical protein
MQAVGTADVSEIITVSIRRQNVGNTAYISIVPIPRNGIHTSYVPFTKRTAIKLAPN